MFVIVVVLMVCFLDVLFVVVSIWFLLISGIGFLIVGSFVRRVGVLLFIVLFNCFSGLPHTLIISWVGG